LEVTGQLEPGKAIEQRVREYLAQRSRAVPSLGDIAAATARHFSLRLADLRSGSRRRAVVTARDVAMYLARTLTGRSFEQIGAYFNGRDHSTVSHGCSKTADLVKSDPALRSVIDQLVQKMFATRRFSVEQTARTDIRGHAPKNPSANDAAATRYQPPLNK
jgi:hypothetical protein